MDKKSKENEPIKGSKEALEAENERLQEYIFKKVTYLNSRKGKVTEQDKAEIIFELRYGI